MYLQHHDTNGNITQEFLYVLSLDLSQEQLCDASIDLMLLKWNQTS